MCLTLSQDEPAPTALHAENSGLSRFEDRQPLYPPFLSPIPEATHGLEIADRTGVPLLDLLGRATDLLPSGAILYTAIHSDDVGGKIVPPGAIGGGIARTGLPILLKENITVISVTAVGFEPTFDRRQLQRWKVAESSLPTESQNRSRPRTVWEQYRWQSTTVLLIFFTQAAFILGIPLERRRRRAEMDANEHFSEIAPMNRHARASELCASIVHELNQPLGAILSNVEMAEVMVRSSSPDLAAAREILADIKRDTLRASEIIRRLRELLTKAPLDKKEMDLNGALGEVFARLKHQAKTHDITLSTALSERELRIMGDRIQVEQVILNLVMNALEAMDEKTNGRREIIGRAIILNQYFAEISIIDNGPGVDPGKFSSIFKPFYTTKANGMGIGLFVAQKIVQAHGGADSGGEPVPRRYRVSDQISSDPVSTGVWTMRILVHLIDDDASFRAALARLLRALGYDVETYWCASEFLKRWSHTNIPSCILLDAQMPGLSGLELQERLAKLGSTLPIVFLTGHGDIPMSVRAIKAGAEDFLTKPVSKDALIDAIGRAMESYSRSWARDAQLRSLRVCAGTLTPREKEVYGLVVQGKQNKQIAHELGTTERTIKAHRHKVMEKMQVRSLAELVTAAERLGTSSIAASISEAHSQPRKRQALVVVEAMQNLLESNGPEELQPRLGKCIG